MPVSLHVIVLLPTVWAIGLSQQLDQLQGLRSPQRPRGPSPGWRCSLASGSELPDELRGLLRRQAVVLHDETWHRDVDGCVDRCVASRCAPAERSGWSRIELNDNPSGRGDRPGWSVALHGVKNARWRARGDVWQVTLETSMKNDGSVEVRHGDYKYGALRVAERPFKASCFATTAEVVDPGLISDARIGFIVSCKPVGYIELMVQGGTVVG